MRAPCGGAECFGLIRSKPIALTRGSERARDVCAFNLLGSGTEIAEDLRAGRETLRRALEMIPGRALLLTVGWRGLFQ